MDVEIPFGAVDAIALALFSKEYELDLFLELFFAHIVGILLLQKYLAALLLIKTEPMSILLRVNNLAIWSLMRSRSIKSLLMQHQIRLLKLMLIFLSNIHFLGARIICEQLLVLDVDGAVVW